MKNWYSRYMISKFYLFFFENYFYRIIFGEQSAMIIEIYKLKLMSMTEDLRTGLDLDRQNVALWFSKELWMKILGSGTIMIYSYRVQSFKFNCSLSQSFKTHCEIAGKNLERSSQNATFLFWHLIHYIGFCLVQF